MFKTDIHLGLGQWWWGAGNGRAGEKAGTPCLKATTTVSITGCGAQRGGAAVIEVRRI